MATLIPDMARALTDANRRVALSVHEGIRRAEAVGNQRAEVEQLRRQMAVEVRVATRHLVTRAGKVQELWAVAVDLLREALNPDEQISILQVFADLADSCRACMESLLLSWASIERLGGQAEGTAVLNDLSGTVRRIHAEASRALRMRVAPWQPTDPTRLEQGRQQALAGQAVTADVARGWFRPVAD